MSLEEATRTSRTSSGGKLAPVSPAALSAKHSMQSLRDGEKSQEGKDATEALRLAQEALSQRDTNQFVIDAPGDETEDVGVDADDAEDDLIASADVEGASQQGRVTGKEAQLAKGEHDTEMHAATASLILTSTLPRPPPPRPPLSRSTIDAISLERERCLVCLGIHWQQQRHFRTTIPCRVHCRCLQLVACTSRDFGKLCSKVVRVVSGA